VLIADLARVVTLHADKPLIQQNEPFPAPSVVGPE
jgi:hypothetical protein